MGTTRTDIVQWREEPMAPYGYNPTDELERYDDPRTLLDRSHTWSSNAAEYAERGEEGCASAAVWAQVAIALAIEGLAAAILATGGFKAPERE